MITNSFEAEEQIKDLRLELIENIKGLIDTGDGTFPLYSEEFKGLTFPWLNTTYYIYGVLRGDGRSGLKVSRPLWVYILPEEQVKALEQDAQITGLPVGNKLVFVPKGCIAEDFYALEGSIPTDTLNRLYQAMYKIKYRISNITFDVTLSDQSSFTFRLKELPKDLRDQLTAFFEEQKYKLRLT
jgi:hypothetical protein